MTATLKIIKTGFRSYELGNWEIVSWDKNSRIAGWIVRSKMDRHAYDVVYSLKAAKIALIASAENSPQG